MTMKKSLLLLLIVTFITLLTSCSKQELKEITITEASAMLQEAKDNTTSVDAYSFGMPLKVTYIDKATFNDELKKEEKYDIKGTIKATYNPLVKSLSDVFCIIQGENDKFIKLCFFVKKHCVFQFKL
jgi:hypothetical protein